jgi:hypothetical protein
MTNIESQQMSDTLSTTDGNQPGIMDLFADYTKIINDGFPFMINGGCFFQKWK